MPSGAWLGSDYNNQSRLDALYLQDSAQASGDQRQPLITDLDYRLTDQRSSVWDTGYYYDLNSNIEQLISTLGQATNNADASALFQ